MEYIKKISSILIVIILTTPCFSQNYYKKVVTNIGEFTNAIHYINQHSDLLSKDTLKLKDGTKISHNNACVYLENVRDSILKKFMLNYQLKRICFSKIDNNYFDSTVTFHKEYSPLTGKAVIITYDFGKSNLRKRIMQGDKLKAENVKIIDTLFLYRIKNKPSFGE